MVLVVKILKYILKNVLIITNVITLLLLLRVLCFITLVVEN